MSTAVAVRPETPNSLIPQTMDEAFKLATMMATAKGLPDLFKNSPGDCLMVIELAKRWRMSPFAVAQCTSAVKGKQLQEGKIVAAAIEGSGAIVGYLDYQFSGAGENLTIVVSATRIGETAPRTVKVVWKDAATDNQWWRKTPEQMLCYHGARVWGRRWTPAVLLGVYTPEEFVSGEAFAGETISAMPEPPSDYVPEPQTRESINAAIPLAGAPESTKLTVVDRIGERLGRCKTISDVARISTAWHNQLHDAAATGQAVPSREEQIAVGELLAFAAERFSIDRGD